MQPSIKLQSPRTEHSRVNVSELKSQLAKRLGPDRASRYFSLLNGLLSQKINKSEFNKLCGRILGKDNLPLHNQLIRSILHNACQTKVPPPVVRGKDSPKPSGILLKKSVQVDDRFKSSEAPGPPVQAFANGHMLPPSPRKSRSGIQNHRNKEQSRTLGPNGRVEAASYQAVAPYDKAVLRENGDASLYNLKRSMQHQQVMPTEQPTKKPKVEKQSLLEAVAGSREDWEHHSNLTDTTGLLRAPLGIPFSSASTGAAKRSQFLAAGTSSGYIRRNYDTGELCDTEVLKKKMEKIAEAQGLDGVTMDCANLLNNGLDVYLKRVIISCINVVGASTTHEPTKLPVSKLQSHVKPVNGVWMGNHMQAQNSSLASEGSHESRKQPSITMQDLLVAMELKPQQLGEDWPLLLEKIRLRSFEK